MYKFQPFSDFSAHSTTLHDGRWPTIVAILLLLGHRPRVGGRHRWYHGDPPPRHSHHHDNLLSPLRPETRSLRGVLLDAQSLCPVVYPSGPPCYGFLEVVACSRVCVHPGASAPVKVGETGTIREDVYPRGPTVTFQGVCVCICLSVCHVELHVFFYSLLSIVICIFT